MEKDNAKTQRAQRSEEEIELTSQMRWIVTVVRNTNRRWWRFNCHQRVGWVIQSGMMGEHFNADWN